METNGQTSPSGINLLQFNASCHKIKTPKMEERPLLPREHTPIIIPKRLTTLKSENNLQNLDRINEICDNEAKELNVYQRSPSPAESLQRLSKISRAHTDLHLHTHSHPNSPNFRRENSARSLRSTYLSDLNHVKPGSDSGSHVSKHPSDATSVRSWASVGMGSTDGKKMIVRRVPTSPVELFNIVNPPTPPEEYLYDGESDNDIEDDDDSVYIKPRRQHWSNKLQFVLACVGYSVGLGSVWRFPYLCYKSGGGVFLIPYAIIMIICGVPMLYMELAVGQFTGRGPIGALGHLCPLLKGTGLGSVLISFLMSTYYSVIIAYGIYYFFTSFKSRQPWEDCSHRWNTANCWVPAKLQSNMSKPLYSQTPAEEFYDRKVLQLGSGIEDAPTLRWELVACLLCAWVLVYFAIWKSIKSSAKVRYFTATLPFLLIVVFLAKSLTLEGADKGMRYFFKPKWEHLGQSKVWVNAAAQTFNSMGIAFGSMISFASYNKYNNNILQDTLAVSFVNAITSLLVGIFAFATIGNIATEQNTQIEDVIADGPGLIFVVYPQMMAKMPAAQLWAVLFFFMLLCLSLNSQFAIVEVVVTSIQDGFPMWIKKNLMCHEVLVLIICVVSFLCGLPNVTQVGIYFFQLIDHYAASISIMYLAFFEVIAIAWFYGAWRLSKNVKTMTGHHPDYYFKFCWMFATPLLIFSVWVFYMIDYQPPTYNNGEYHYPVWAIVLGWVISSLSILCIPIFMIYVFIQTEGDTLLEKLRNSLKSDLDEKCPRCGEPDCDCIFDEDDVEPMLVMHGPVKAENHIPVDPLYIQTITNPLSIINTVGIPKSPSPVSSTKVRREPNNGSPPNIINENVKKFSNVKNKKIDNEESNRNNQNIESMENRSVKIIKNGNEASNKNGTDNSKENENDKNNKNSNEDPNKNGIDKNEESKNVEINKNKESNKNGHDSDSKENENVKDTTSNEEPIKSDQDNDQENKCIDNDKNSSEQSDKNYQLYGKECQVVKNIIDEKQEKRINEGKDDASHTKNENDNEADVKLNRITSDESGISVSILEKSKGGEGVKNIRVEKQETKINEKTGGDENKEVCSNINNHAKDEIVTNIIGEAQERAPNGKSINDRVSENENNEKPSKCNAKNPESIDNNEKYKQ